MHVEQGSSFLEDADAAVAAATEAWADGPDMVFVFCSTKQNAEAVASAVKRRFPRASIAGCTSAGEHVRGVHSNGSLVIAGLYDSRIRWATRLVRGVTALDEERAEAAVDQLFSELDIDRETLNPTDYFSLLFMDGLSMAEERVTALLAEAMEGIPLAGGSAADDLAFSRTFVISDEGAADDAAVVVMGVRGPARVEMVKHQHFVTTPRSLCITKADVATRTVYEMDGYPAAEAYAGALGLSREQLTDDITFLNPITFSCAGDIYVRSIQKVNDDASITFYCAIEEGMVLDIGGHEDMKNALSTGLGELREKIGKADFVLGFNCILRALEAQKNDAHDGLGEVMREHCRAMIGFDTYGEQLNGLHINQTLVAVAIVAGGEHVAG